MHQILVIGLGDLGLQLVLGLVAGDEVEAQEDDDQDQQHVAAHVGGEGDEVARLVGVEEDLGPDGVAGGPGDEVCRNDVSGCFLCSEEYVLMATQADFFVCPAMLRDSIDMASVCAAQNESTM
jgi:hypothetical protein